MAHLVYTDSDYAGDSKAHCSITGCHLHSWSANILEMEITNEHHLISSEAEWITLSEAVNDISLHYLLVIPHAN